MGHKYITVSNQQEFDRAVEYFKAMGYPMSPYEYEHSYVHEYTKNVAVWGKFNESGYIWASSCERDFEDEEHFLPNSKEKYIIVYTQEEAEKAVKYFENMGHKLGDFLPIYEHNTTTVVTSTRGDIWHCSLAVGYFADTDAEQHFLPEETLPDIYIPIGNEEEFNQAKLLVEEMGYIARYNWNFDNKYDDNTENITCEDGKWYTGTCEEDDSYFEGFQKYLLKSTLITVFSLEKGIKPEKTYMVSIPDTNLTYDMNKQQISDYIVQLQNLIDE